MEAGHEVAGDDGRSEAALGGGGVFSGFDASSEGVVGDFEEEGAAAVADAGEAVFFVVVVLLAVYGRFFVRKPDKT